MLYLVFSYFVIYSFLGWICEVVYCAIYDKHFVNRGFLHGPICPIYGCGALAVLYVLVPIQEQVFFIFVFGTLIGSMIEYVTSHLLELVFGLKLWNYSNYKYNLNGRVCLKNSLLFGVLSVVIVKVIHPKVEYYIGTVSETTLQLLVLLTFCYYLADFVISASSFLKLTKRIVQLKLLMEEKATVLEKYTKYVQENLHHIQSEAIEELHKSIEVLGEKISEIQNTNRYTYRRIIAAFPKIKSIKHQQYLEKIKAEMKKASRRDT